MPAPRSSTQQHGPQVYSRRAGAPAPPTDAAYVGRPSAFGNPFAIGRDGDRATVIARYEQWLHAPEQAGLRERAVRELRGRDLVCWCAPQACHADVLLQLVNTTEVAPVTNRHGDQDDTALRCIDGPEGCTGPVAQRWPGYGQRTWPRCEHHGDARVTREDAHRDEIPDGACIPADFDPADAGERWAET